MQARRILRDRFIPHLALVFLLLGLLAVASHAQTFSPPLQLNANGMDPRMAVDTNGNINVVWHHLLDSGVWFTRSTDGGATFSTPTLIPGIPARNSSNLQIAVDSSDAIHVLATASVRTAPGHSVEEIFYAHSSNGGATFSVTSIANGETYILWGPLMAVAPSGSVNILWIPLDPLQPGPSTGLKLSVSRSTDGGATFSTTAVWNWPDSAGIMGGDEIVVDANEDIYVAWHYCLGSQPCNLLFSRSTDQGKTYSSPTVLGSGANPEMVIDSSGNLDLA